MPPRRILVVSDEMEIGGSQRQIAQLLGGLSREHWRPELLFFRERSFLVDEIEASGVPCHHLPKRGRFDARFVLRLIALLRRRRYDLVHCYSLTAEMWLRAIRPWVPHAVSVVSVRGLCLGYADWQWWCKRWILGRADAVIANARAGARHTAERTGLDLGYFDTIPNGVPLPAVPAAAQRAALHASLGVPAGRVLALFVGRLVAEKNVALLLAAMASLPPAQRPWLALVGAGPLQAALEARAAALGLNPDLRFCGARSDAPALIAAADIVVLPSSEEGLSNVVLEAMAAARPVLASAVGGNPELIEHGRTGLLFRSGDTPALAVGLRRLTADAALRTQLGDAARRHVQRHYAVADMVAQTESVYARCLAREAGIGAPAAPPRARPLRLLLLLESHFPAHAGGGAESQVRTLALRLRRLGHRVTVLTPRVRGGPTARVERYEGIAVCRLPFPPLRGVASLVLWTRLAAFLWRRRGRYHAWHVHIAHYLGAIACLLARAGPRPVPVVVKVSGSWELEHGVLAAGRGPVAALAQRCLKQADALQAISRRIAGELAAHGFDRDRIVILPNAVDTARFRDRRPAVAPARPRTAVFVGRLVREKGLDVLLSAWAQAFADRRDLRLDLVGRGELEAGLRRQAEQLGIAGQVRFLGHRAQVEDVLAEADFGILPSLIEGLSNTLLEFMASSLPVLASRVSGSEDLVVSGRNGWLVDAGDVAALAAALVEAAALDAAALRTLGEQARRDVEAAAGLDSVVGRLLSLYRGAAPDSPDGEPAALADPNRSGG